MALRSPAALLFGFFIGGLAGPPLHVLGQESTISSALTPQRETERIVTMSVVPFPNVDPADGIPSP